MLIRDGMQTVLGTSVNSLLKNPLICFDEVGTKICRSCLFAPPSHPQKTLSHNVKSSICSSVGANTGTSIINMFLFDSRTFSSAAKASKQSDATLTGKKEGGKKRI